MTRVLWIYPRRGRWESSDPYKVCYPVNSARVSSPWRYARDRSRPSPGNSFIREILSRRPLHPVAWPPGTEVPEFRANRSFSTGRPATLDRIDTHVASPGFSTGVSPRECCSTLSYFISEFFKYISGSREVAKPQIPDTIGQSPFVWSISPPTHLTSVTGS